MKIYLSHLDGNEKNPFKNASETIFINLARFSGVRIAHNNATIWKKRQHASIKKYHYQQSYKSVWANAYNLARRMLQYLDWPFESEHERIVFENALASSLFRPVFDDCIYEKLKCSSGFDVSKWPTLSNGFSKSGFLIGRLFFLQQRIFKNESLPFLEVKRPNGVGKANWLVFSGHSPSKAILNVLDYLDPGKTVALVNRAYVWPKVVQELAQKRIPVYPVIWDNRQDEGELSRLYASLFRSIQRVEYPFFEAAHVEELAKFAYWWVVHTGTVKMMNIPFQPGDQLITGNDRNLHMAAFVLEAQRRGVETITLQDGVFGDTEHITSFPSQRIGVIGERYRQFYLDAGRAVDCVVNIGHKGWSGLNVMPVDEALKARLFKTNKKVALFCTQYYPVSDLETHDMLECCLNVFRRRSDWAFFIKPHPHYCIDHILDLIPGAHKYKINGPIEPLLMACDCNLALHSTTLIEAALLGRKSAAINLAGLEDLCFSADGQAVQELHSANDLDRFLDEAASFDYDVYRQLYASSFDSTAVAKLLSAYGSTPCL